MVRKVRALDSNSVPALLIPGGSFRAEVVGNCNPKPVLYLRLDPTRERLGAPLVFEINGLPSIELKYHYPDVDDDKILMDKLRSQEDLCMKVADLAWRWGNCLLLFRHHHRVFLLAGPRLPPVRFLFPARPNVP